MMSALLSQSRREVAEVTQRHDRARSAAVQEARARQTAVGECTRLQQEVERLTSELTSSREELRECVQQHASILDTERRAAERQLAEARCARAAAERAAAELQRAASARDVQLTEAQQKLGDSEQRLSIIEGEREVCEWRVRKATEALTLVRQTVGVQGGQMAEFEWSVSDEVALAALASEELEPGDSTHSSSVAISGQLSPVSPRETSPVAASSTPEASSNRLGVDAVTSNGGWESASLSMSRVPPPHLFSRLLSPSPAHSRRRHGRLHYQRDHQHGVKSSVAEDSRYIEAVRQRKAAEASMSMAQQDLAIARANEARNEVEARRLAAEVRHR